MSKIFEALVRNEGSAAKLAKAVLADDVVAAVAAKPVTERACTGVLADETQDTQLGSPLCSVLEQTIQLAQGSPILPFDGSHTEAAEQYRIIRTRIQQHPAQPRMLMVSSPMPGDGKTISAINVAAALSLQDRVSVLLLDCDFQRSSVGEFLGLGAAPGFRELLQDHISLSGALVRIAQFPNLYVLTSGAVSQSPGELLSTERWQWAKDEFLSKFCFVVADAPPIGAVAEYDMLQSACDGVVLVVRQDHTNRQLWQKALDTVPKAKLLVEEWFLWKTQSYYYYSGRAAR
jgi:capsular exopolysaccharide synthesis family protein